MTPYPKYKPSGIEWIGNIPEHWNTIAIKHLVSTKVTDGPHETPEFLEEGVVFVSAEAVKDGKIDFNFKRGYISKELDLEYSKKCKPQRGDIFIVKSGSTTGKIAYVDFDDNFSVWSPLALVRTKSCIDSRYVFYSFSSEYFFKSIQLFWSFGTQPNIGMNVIENLRVVVPPLEEQIKATIFLDEKVATINNLISNKQKLINLLKEEKTAIINEAVTKGINKKAKLKPSGIEWIIDDVPGHWEKRRVSTFGSFSKGKGIKKDEVKSTGLPCIRYGEIYTIYDRVVYSTVSYIDIETSQNSELIRKGDVLFTGSGETVEDIGKAVVYYGNNGIYVGGDIIILKLRNDIDPLFVSYLMNCNYVAHQKTVAGRGDIIVHIYSKNIREIETYLPPLVEQKMIVEFLDKKINDITHAITRIEKEIELMQEYRTALISEVVTGKVRVV